MERLNRDPVYAVGGAVVAGGITALFWLGAGAAVASGAIAVATAVGALVGVVTGSGGVKDAWSGAVGATVITAIAAAAVNFAILMIIGAHTH